MKNIEGISWKVIKKSKRDFHESDLLNLNCNKAKTKLNWSSILNFKETIKMSVDWYKEYYSNSKKIYLFSSNQIKFYQKLLKKRLYKSKIKSRT